MSPPPIGNPASSPQPFQIILESFTRCFSPISEPCTKAFTASNTTIGTDGGAAPLGRDGPCSSAGHPLGSNAGSGEKLSRAVSRSDSSGESRRRRKAKPVLSAEELAERSKRRKLEIFRGTPPPPPGAAAEARPSQQGPGQQGQPQPSPSPQGRQKRPASPKLLLSNDEEDLIRHAKGRKFDCGVNMGQMGRGSPISSVARLFNLGVKEARKPFGLCFANPVRTASLEDVANMSDDKLTDDEFLRRHCGMGRETGAVVTPEVEADGSESTYNEEETVSSTLYFETKYSHLVQTRPPMPLYREYAVACGMGTGVEDGLAQIIKRQWLAKERGGGQPPIQQVLGKRSSPGKGASRSKAGSKGSFRFSISPKKQRGASGGGGGGGDGGSPSPARTGEKGPSVHTVSNDSNASMKEVVVRKLEKPGVISATAAEF